MKKNREIEGLRADLERRAREFFPGRGWLSAWARESGWEPKTLRTFLYRGKREPSAEKLGALRAAIGYVETSTARAPKPLWQMEGVRDRRWFTSLVEDLRRIDRSGRGKAWITAWVTVKAAAQILRTLDDADDETHWKAIFGEDGPPVDHWKRLTGKTELSVTEQQKERP